MTETCNVLDQLLNDLNLICISPFIIDYLFGNKKHLSEKLNFVTSMNMEKIKQLIMEMSIIIIDITSSEMITIPLHSSKLLITNSNFNQHTSSPVSSSTGWTMRWSLDNTITSKSFQSFMNDICDSINKDDNMLIYFTVYNDALSQSIAQFEKRERFLENKIQRCYKQAKAKAKKRDRKGALFELKKKKQLENQLNSIRTKKMNLECQIFPIDSPSPDDIMDAAMDISENIDDILAQPLNFMMDEESEELEELDNIRTDEINAECKNESQGVTFRVLAPLTASEDEELAELEAMMN